jgi:chromosome segregation ATPase
MFQSQREPHQALSQARDKSGNFVKKVGRRGHAPLKQQIAERSRELKEAKQEIVETHNALVAMEAKCKRDTKRTLASAFRDVNVAVELSAAKVSLASLKRELNSADDELADARNAMKALENSCDAAATARQQLKVKVMHATKSMRREQKLASTLRTMVANKDHLILRLKQKLFVCEDAAKELKQKVDDLEDRTSVPWCPWTTSIHPARRCRRLRRLPMIHTRRLVGLPSSTLREPHMAKLTIAATWVGGNKTPLDAWPTMTLNV